MNIGIRKLTNVSKARLVELFKANQITGKP